MSTITAPADTSILARFKHVRATTELLCEPLNTEDYIPQPIVDVSPPKWHLGHTTWFFETFVLTNNAPGYQVFDDQFGFLFNSYYESVGQRVQRAHRGNLSRPTVQEVYNYRRHVDAAMEQFLNSGAAPESLLPTIELGLQHEQQHQELFVTDFKFILGENPLHPAYKEPETHTAAARSANWLEVEEGLYSIGSEGNGFSFDNEHGRHKVFLPAFRIMDRLVTNAEYLEFIAAGGYSDFRSWLSEGWEWVKANNISAPQYWIIQDGEPMQFTMGGLQQLNVHEPVTHLSYYEADAFASWKGLRLPTEFEWETACNIYAPQIPEQAQFQDSGRFQPAACTSENNQFFGDCWEWTSSAYLPYPYYAAAEGAIGEYNGKFMVNQMVLRGGSVATPRDHIRATYRNFFHPHLRWQFTGLRLAEYIQ